MIIRVLILTNYIPIDNHTLRQQQGKELRTNDMDTSVKWNTDLLRPEVIYLCQQNFVLQTERKTLNSILLTIPIHEDIKQWFRGCSQQSINLLHRNTSKKMSQKNKQTESIIHEHVTTF